MVAPNWLRGRQVTAAVPSWVLWKELRRELDSTGSQKTLLWTWVPASGAGAWEVGCCSDAHRSPERLPDISGTVC